MSGYGPIHTLIVYEVGEDDPPFHIAEFDDFEIDHPVECAFDSYYDDRDEGNYVCGVEYNANAVGVRWSLSYSGTPVTEPGEYPIQAWSEVCRGFEYTEYDGGVGVVDPEDIDE